MDTVVLEAAGTATTALATSRGPRHSQPGGRSMCIISPLFLLTPGVEESWRKGQGKLRKQFMAGQTGDLVTGKGRWLFDERRFS
jgi:hypothetical protein